VATSAEGARQRSFIDTFFAYGAAKGAVFVLPLWLSNTLSRHDYGAWEFCLSAAMVLALAAGFGAPGAVPYFILHRGRPAFAPAFRTLASLFACAAPVAGLAYVVGALGIREYLIVALTAILVSQSLSAWLLRSQQRPAASALAEGAVYAFVLLALFAWHAGAGGPVSLPTVAAAVGPYSVLFACFCLRNSGLPQIGRNFRKRLVAIAHFGLPPLLASVLYSLFLMTPRFALESANATDAVGIYAFLARIAAIGMILFQVNMMARFRENYLLDRAGADGLLAPLLGFFFAVGLAVFAVVPALLAPISDVVRSMTPEDRRAFYWLCVESAVWFACSQLELVCYREKKARHFAVILASATALFWIACVSGLVPLRLPELARLHTGLFALVLAAQSLMLRPVLGFPKRLLLLLGALAIATLGLEAMLFQADPFPQ
jgi:O-antigen/teichoic acid export membrane protein